MAFARCVKLRHVLDSQDLSVPLKLRIYQVVVCSVLSYGCETWTLSPDVIKMLNRANSRMLSRFTGKTSYHRRLDQSRVVSTLSAPFAFEDLSGSDISFVRDRPASPIKRLKSNSGWDALKTFSSTLHPTPV